MLGICVDNCLMLPVKTSPWPSFLAPQVCLVLAVEGGSTRGPGCLPRGEGGLICLRGRGCF